MILPDINLWVYAHRPDMEQHEACAPLMERIAAGDEPFAFATLTVASFVRIVTNPRVYDDPSPTADALRFIDELRKSPVCRWIEPGPRWWRIFGVLCREGGAKGNLVPDAALAALAIEHGCELLTADRGFGRYPGLRWSDPLA